MGSTSKADPINYLNIGLMVLSAALALRWPFELFLIVYAVLGPLHYLTEISWLHDRNYYTRGKQDYLFLLAASLLITAFYFNWIPFTPKGAVEFLTYLSFAAAFIFAFFKGAAARLVGIGVAVAVAGSFAQFAVYKTFFGILLPTLVHVFIFTGLFILAGALRGRSLSGLLSLLVFTGAAAGLLLYHPDRSHYQVADYVRDSYGVFQPDGKGSSPFISLNYAVANLFKMADFNRPGLSFAEALGAINQFLYQNPAALALMSFIAFAYTYHYLNWFSKTSVIRWHEIPRNRFAAILLIWVGSLILYGYSYGLGFRWLFFLSFTHVLLEFPLNHLTFIGIGKALGGSLIAGPKNEGNVEV